MTQSNTVPQSEFTKVPLSALEPDPDNIRTMSYQKKADRELIGSIMAEGVLQNLIVKPIDGDKFQVKAGNRRLAACQELAAAGTISEDFPMPVKISTTDTVSDAIAENLVRVPMHPADEFAAFQRLEEQGIDVDAIAERFGCSAKKVRQRLRLANVAPTIMKAYRNGNLNLETLEAFAMTTDKKRQLAVWRELKGGRVSAWAVRKGIKGNQADQSHHLVGVVTDEAYEADGGKLTRDLFSENRIYHDVGKLEKLARLVLDDVHDSIADEGWSWIHVAPVTAPLRYYDIEEELGISRTVRGKLNDVPQELTDKINSTQLEAGKLWEQVDEEEDFDRRVALERQAEELEKQHQALEHERDGLRAWSARCKKYAGVAIFIDDDSQINVLRGLVRKEDDPNLKKGKKSGKSKDEAAPDAPKVSQALLTDLRRHRDVILQAGLALCPRAAIDILHFDLVLRGSEVWSNSGLFADNVYCKPNTVPARGLEDTPHMRTLVRLADELPRDWIKESDGICDVAGSWAAWQQLEQETRDQLVAYVIGVSASTHGHRNSEFLPLAMHYADADTASWRPTVENYFGRLTKPQLVALGGELFGEQWLKDQKAKKKPDLAMWFEIAAEKGDDAYGDAGKEFASWLPPIMRFEDDQ